MHLQNRSVGRQRPKGPPTDSPVIQKIDLMLTVWVFCLTLVSPLCWLRLRTSNPRRILMIPYLNRSLFLCFSIGLSLPIPLSSSYAHSGQTHCAEMESHGLGGYTFPISTSNPQVQTL